MTNKLLGFYNVFSRLVVVGDSCDSEVMTLYIFAKPFEKLYDPLDILVGWISALTRWKNNILILRINLLLICLNSVIGILIKRHLTSSTFLCIEVYHSETLCIWLYSFEIIESWPDDIFQSKSTLMQQLDHGIRL